jgi:formamidopyrimidine-DNA glycosylase
MPEVIEIRKYADFLRKILKNINIEEINILKGRYKTHGPFNLYSKIKKNLPLKVIDIRTKGKFLYIILEDNFYIFVTLGLKGGWVYLDNKTKKYKFPILIDYIRNNNLSKYHKIALNNLNVEFKTTNGSLYYFDSLSFGTIKVIDNLDILDNKLKKLGPDIMDKSTKFEVFKNQILQKKNLEKVIGIVLMEQNIVSGIGNYLRSDILWLSKISPFRKIKDLNEDELKLLYKNAKLLTWGDYNYKEALKLKIIKKYNKLPKNYGRNFFVYDSIEDIYGNKVIKEELYVGSQKRSIYWVQEIQK